MYKWGRFKVSLFIKFWVVLQFCWLGLPCWCFWFSSFLFNQIHFNFNNFFSWITVSVSELFQLSTVPIFHPKTDPPPPPKKNGKNIPCSKSLLSLLNLDIIQEVNKSSFWVNPTRSWLWTSCSKYRSYQTKLLLWLKRLSSWPSNWILNSLLFLQMEMPMDLVTSFWMDCLREGKGKRAEKGRWDLEQGY